jgi:RNAse (barnase) inhibitor barstar
LLAALFSDSFYRALPLLAATALLTGFLVPVIKSQLDDRKLRQQKVFESELARQSKVIESQAKLLDDLSDLLWGFLLLSLAVTFYATHESKEKFKKAWAA